jgi:predicted aminopeptidase
MEVLKFFGLCLCFLLSSCQIKYIVKSAYNQASLLNHRVPIEVALKDPNLSEEQKRKILLARKASDFAEKELGLKATENYTSFVMLDRPYVTYVVSAAPKWKLEPYNWHYPLIGAMPYKGFFNEPDAQEEEEELKKKNLDTFMRGVSAYSTLGWFRDPLLSSMLRYKDFDLVDTIIHETVHATLFIKAEADFNERLAVFLGNKGAELFYLKEEGADSPTLLRVKDESADDKLFSAWLGPELKDLEKWYNEMPESERTEEKRTQRLARLQENFKRDLLPKLKGDGYSKFTQVTMNNARLLVYRTYMQDLEDFEKLFQKTGRNFKAFLEECKKLQKVPEPTKALKELL